MKSVHGKVAAVYIVIGSSDIRKTNQLDIQPIFEQESSWKFISCIPMFFMYFLA